LFASRQVSSTKGVVLPGPVRQTEAQFSGERITTGCGQSAARTSYLDSILETVKLRGVNRRAYLRLAVEAALDGDTCTLPHECAGVVAERAQQNIREAGERLQVKP
jgi:hypothetical protein